MVTAGTPRLIRRALPWDVEPAEALRLLRADAHPVALFGAWQGGSDLVASEPVAVRCPPRALGDVLDGWPGRPDGEGEPTADVLGFGGGWIGYLGFGLAERLLPAPAAPGGPRRLPWWWFGFYDHVLRRDRATGRWAFEALWTPEREAHLGRRFDDLVARGPGPAARPREYQCGEFGLHPSAEEHRSAVRRAVEYIRRGDLFQANICLRLEAPFAGDPLDAFCRAASELRPPYAAYVGVPGGAVASLSPELFLRRTGNRVVTRPIKGTARRSADRRDAIGQRDLLLRSGKDRAEHLMIVDLMRNDLSRVCAPGTVEVARLLGAEQHPGVWHLVSEVRGSLVETAGDAALIAAAFPPGSVTGAPKVRSVETIHELESVPREVYTGAVGYRSPFAGLELNVAIRTFEFHGGRVWLGSGGGVTARSDPEEEFQECLVKAGPLITALGAVLGDADRTGPSPVRGTTPGWLRPRPAIGVFTSLRVTDGRAHRLGRHLARLQDSTTGLYGKSLPATIADQVAECVAAQPTGRLRITAQPVGGPLRITVEVVPLERRPPTAVLRPVTLAGGLGSHKWRDRTVLAELTRGCGPGEQLLIRDTDGTALETDRASLFAVLDGVLHTPPADGRILPGVTRAAVLDAARASGLEVAERPLTEEGLSRAAEVFVTNSVSGVTPVVSVTGTDAHTWTAGPVAARVVDLLERRPADAVGAVGRRNDTRPVATVGKARTDGPRTDGPRTDGARTDLGRPDVLLVDNYDSFTYNLAHLLLAEGCRVEVVRNDEVPVAAVAGYGASGIVISPGPCGPTDAGISVEVVRECGPTVPVLGICLGHQAIAAAYGAAVTVAPEPVHGRSSAVTHDGRGVLAGLSPRILAGRYHSLVVMEASLPDCLEVSARTDDGLVMGVRHHRHPVEGIQFHPESVLTEHGGAIIHTFVRALGSRSVGERAPAPRARA